MIVEPSSCRYCGIPERDHMQRWTTGIGWHQWTVPTNDQIKARMRARRKKEDRMTAEERLTAYLCQQPGTEHMDTHHADMARQILDQHEQELSEQPQSVIDLADRLRETATVLATRNDITATDDPLTLLRCLHATAEALAGIAPAALAAADLDGKNPYTGSGVADIPGRIAAGLGSATNALWDAYNAV